MEELNEKLEIIMKKYSDNFTAKTYGIESEESDILMEAFNITQTLKKENKQYWGRELGMCWQLLVTEVFREYGVNFQPAKKYDGDEPADFFVETDGVDTKYRVGSGDSGTLKKFKQYGRFLPTKGYRPVLLLLRTDNLSAAIQACITGGWTIYSGERSFEYIKNKTDFDLKQWLIEKKGSNQFKINR